MIKTTTVLGLGAISFALATPGVAADAEHKFQLKSRLIHFDRDYEKDSKDREQTALGIQLNYESPQFNDLIGVGVSGYLVEEIDHDGSLSEDILTKESNGELDGFALIGQAYVKLTPTESTSFKLGRQTHKTMLLASSGSRAVPNTFQGVSGKFAPSKGLTVYGAVYDEWSRRARDTFEGFATDNSAEGSIDYVSVFGVKYKTKKYSVEAEYLNSDDYLSKLGLRGSYNIPLEASKLKVSGGVFASYDDGSLFTIGAEKDQDDEDGTSAGNDGLGAYAQLTWIMNNLELSGAVSQFDGLWIEDNFAGDHGRNPFPTRSAVGPDLTNANETAAMLSLKYDWKDSVPGLITTVAFGRGWDAENTADASSGTADEDWKTLDVAYKVPQVKGLKLRGVWHDYNSDKVGSVDGVKDDETDIRLYVDYVYNF